MKKFTTPLLFLALSTVSFGFDMGTAKSIAGDAIKQKATNAIVPKGTNLIDEKKSTTEKLKDKAIKDGKKKLEMNKSKNTTSTTKESTITKINKQYEENKDTVNSVAGTLLK